MENMDGDKSRGKGKEREGMRDLSRCTVCGYQGRFDGQRRGDSNRSLVHSIA